MPRCNFCFTRNPRDPFAYTHFVRDAEGGVQCPFLKLIRCDRCGERGHVARHCHASHADALAHDMHTRLHMADPTYCDPDNPGAARIFCRYCYHSFPQDPICQTHHTHDPRSGNVLCPRLLHHCCQRCGQRGHTPRYCPSYNNNNNKSENKNGLDSEPDDPNLIVTFSDSEEE
jgi:hypothetical protein